MTQLVTRGLSTGVRRALSSFGWSLVALAGMLALNSLLGPLLLGVVDYPISASMTNQLLGLEVVTLVLVVPWTGLVGALALRQDPRAPLLALGPTSYAAYMFVQYVVGPEYGTYSWVVLFHVAIVALSGGLALVAWSKAQREPVPSISDKQRRRLGLVLMGLAAFVLARYLPADGSPSQRSSATLGHLLVDRPPGPRGRRPAHGSRGRGSAARHPGGSPSPLRRRGLVRPRTPVGHRHGRGDARPRRPARLGVEPVPPDHGHSRVLGGGWQCPGSPRARRCHAGEPVPDTRAQ
jgi:hypothetical protein